MADHDSSYRLLFSHPRMVEDLLRGFVQEPWVEKLDFSTLDKVGASYVSDDLQARHQDLIWRIRWHRREEEWLYVYLVFEFQSTVDRFMAVRVLAYLALLYQDLIRRGEKAPSGKLPQVVPLVLYNGKKRWWAAREVSNLIEPLPGGLSVYRPRLRYLLLDEGRAAPLEPADRRNLAAALFRVEKSREPTELRVAVAELVDELKRSGRVELRRAFSTWILQTLIPERWPEVGAAELGDLDEVKTMLEETVREWFQQWKQEGLQEGLQEGRKRGEREGRRRGEREGRKEGRREGLRQGEAQLFLRLLRGRFGPVDRQIRALVAAADSQQILAWSDRLLTAGSLDEIFNGSGPPPE